MAEWKRVRLGDVADLALGKMLDSKKNHGSPYRYLNNVAVRWGSFDLDELPEMRFEQDEFERYLIRENDIVICEGGEPGRCAIWKNSDPIFYQKALHRARVRESACARFVYYSFKNLVISGATKHYETGSTIRHLPAQNLKEIEIPLPPLSTQKKIAAVLGAIDDKIEANRKICANLEAQAQALFKSWFVDFEPFGGKMPKDWKEIKLSEIADFYGGYSYKGEELQASNCAMATIKNFERGGGFKLDGFKEIIPSPKLKPFHEVDIFDVLVAHTDLTQKAEVIGNAEMLMSKAGYDKIIMSMDLVKVLPKKGVSKFLLGALLKNPVFKAHCLRYVNGTTVLHMSKSALDEYSLWFPDNSIALNRVSELLESNCKKISAIIDESRALASMRDALLPRLMSGEIDVEKVEVA